MVNHREFASPQVAQLLEANGIHDLDSAFRVGEPLDEEHEGRATRHFNRRVVKVALRDESGATTDAYIKRQWKRDRLLPRPTDLRHRTRLLCSPVHEWRGLNTLQKAGFQVSEPLALFWSGWGFSRGAVVTRAVPPTRSISDLLYSGDLEQMDSAKRSSLIEAATRLIARFYKERISWRSMKAKHFYPEDLGSNNWRIWLIDCEGVCRRASCSDCERDWRSYLQSLAAHAPALHNAFIEAYQMALGMF